MENGLTLHRRMLFSIINNYMPLKTKTKKKNTQQLQLPIVFYGRPLHTFRTVCIVANNTKRKPFLICVFPPFFGKNFVFFGNFYAFGSNDLFTISELKCNEFSVRCDRNQRSHTKFIQLAFHTRGDLIWAFSLHMHGFLLVLLFSFSWWWCLYVVVLLLSLSVLCTNSWKSYIHAIDTKWERG